MSVRLQCIAKLLEENHKLPRDPLPRLAWKELRKNSSLFDNISNIFTALGGKGPFPEIEFPFYDLEFEGLAIQLDEEKSFNRYRAITLQSPAYSQLKNFPIEKYRSYCRNFEAECLKSASHGKFWTTAATEKFFGAPGEVGDLFQNGAPSWKYKAFQDFLLDLTPLFHSLKMVRFSIYDNLLINGKMYRISDVVISSRPDLKAALSKNMERRIESLATV